MAIKTIKLNDATLEELRAFSKKLNLDVPPRANAFTIRAVISNSGYVKPDFEIETPDAPVSARPAAPIDPMEQYEDPKMVQARQAERDARMVPIFIDIVDEKGGDRDVFVSYNGRSMLIPRGREVSIPYPFYEVLKNAVRSVGEQKYDDRGMPSEIVYRNVTAYPFRVMQRAA
mgnify:CR=1 FL=1